MPCRFLETVAVVLCWMEAMSVEAGSRCAYGVVPLPWMCVAHSALDGMIKCAVAPARWMRVVGWRAVTLAFRGSGRGRAFGVAEESSAPFRLQQQRLRSAPQQSPHIVWAGREGGQKVEALA